MMDCGESDLDDCRSPLLQHLYMSMQFEYDVIVVGGGHAGCEAAAAAAHMGKRTLLVTSDLNRVAQMSCNPAIGGIAKGQIVREIDALGGLMGIVADRTAIQFRMLNRSKGPAVWSPRVQSDREKFISTWRSMLEGIEGLDLYQDLVTSLILSDDNKEVRGVRTAIGVEFAAPKVILTAGTFLNGLMHFGPVKVEGGRIAEAPSHGITEQLRAIGFETGRMKTGTPARLDGRTIDFDLCEEQWGDTEEYYKFSFLPEVKRELPSRSCQIVHTSEEVHEVLRSHLDESPLFNGQIQSIGPRYCPSIETKITTFADKESHQLFLEPEGVATYEYYVNGFSSSLPWEVQLEALRKIPALRNVHMLRPGYAIEYDYFPPTQLTHDLQTKLVKGLYFAGQVNGTTGYEEAAAQGLMAGINAVLSLRGEQPLVLGRDKAYIGVLIDDLVTKGVDEPYRMFTSRAEYRILLRQDDADMRLTEIGHSIGLADNRRYEIMLRKRRERDALMAFMCEERVGPSTDVNAWLASLGSRPLERGASLAELLKRPQVSLRDMAAHIKKLRARLDLLSEGRDETPAVEVAEAAEIMIKYEGYVVRERQLAEKARRLEDVRLPDKFDYSSLISLSTEARQKLEAIRPQTIGAASRIPGVSPADISILLMLLSR